MSTILIAGANRGLGLEFTRQYAADGDRVIAACRAPGKAHDLTSLAASSKGKITVHPLDVSDDASVRTFKEILGKQPIDIVIANAGVYGGSKQGWSDMDFDAWMRTLAVNTMGPLRLAQATVDNLKAGSSKVFVAITSQMGSNESGGGGGMHAYRTSKAALNKLISGMAGEWKSDNLIAVPIHPGWVQTDMGGPSAPLKPEQSVSAMRKTIASLKPGDSGHFLNYDGTPLPW